jgi:hypothetical protein
VGRAEIDVGALHLVAFEDEELGVTEAPSTPGNAPICDEGFIAFDENSLQLVALDPAAALPAALEISRLVDVVVVGTGEAEIVAERVLDALAIIRQLGCKNPADRIRPVAG